MKKFLSSLDVSHIPLFLFICATSKYLILTPNIFESIVLFILGVTAFLYQYFSQNKKYRELELRVDEKFKKFEVGVENLAQEKIKLQSELNGLKLRVGGSVTSQRGSKNVRRF